ncbi:hypothetical protein DER45DRAFT_539010 [Fusarium avenaceum]|nr:hypothetical protein DER45DRAFT_539010 [Fusarium avenaceum]
MILIWGPAPLLLVGLDQMAGHVNFAISASRNYDTTESEETIAGALEHYSKKNNSKMSGTPCRDLTYRGAWTSYFTVGPVKSFNHKLHCGPGLDLDNCASGGKDDLH